MNNCYNCKYKTQMGSMIGCSLKKQIIIEPESIKECAEGSNTDFMNMFNNIMKGKYETT